MTTAHLGHYLKPAGAFDLVRLGRDHDGGYLVDRRDVLDSTALVSLGINDDWSFEDDFLTMNPVPLDAYDGTVSPKIYSRRVVKHAISGNKRELKSSAKALLGYKKFFTGERRHHSLMVGYAEDSGTTTLDAIFAAKAGESDRVFLKVDIEGWEYRVFDSIIDHASRISSLAIELHDYDLHRDTVRDFIKATGLAVAHVHCNNWGTLAKDGTPLAIEVTLSSQQPLSNEPTSLPHPLDQANNATIRDIPITFE